MKILKGIAWNHTRGFTSVVATAQRFEAISSHITWMQNGAKHNHLDSELHMAP